MLTFDEAIEAGITRTDVVLQVAGRGWRQLSGPSRLRIISSLKILTDHVESFLEKYRACENCGAAIFKGKEDTRVPSARSLGSVCSWKCYYARKAELAEERKTYRQDRRQQRERSKNDDDTRWSESDPAGTGSFSNSESATFTNHSTSIPAGTP